MNRKLALVFGMIFAVVGVLGFFKQFSYGGLLFGLFETNLERNVLTVVAGVLGVLCSLLSSAASRGYFAIFGGIFVILGVLGCVQGGTMVLGMIATNAAGNVWHLAWGVVFLLAWGLSAAGRKWERR